MSHGLVQPPTSCTLFRCPRFKEVAKQQHNLIFCIIHEQTEQKGWKFFTRKKSSKFTRCKKTSETRIEDLCSFFELEISCFLDKKPLNTCYKPTFRSRELSRVASRLFARFGKGLNGGSLAALTHGDVRGPMPPLQCQPQ